MLLVLEIAGLCARHFKADRALLAARRREHVVWRRREHLRAWGWMPARGCGLVFILVLRERAMKSEHHSFALHDARPVRRQDDGLRGGRPERGTQDERADEGAQQ